MKYKFYAEASFLRSTEKVFEIPDSDFEGMTKAQRDDYVADQWDTWFWDQCNGGFEAVDSVTE